MKARIAGVATLLVIAIGLFLFRPSSPRVSEEPRRESEASPVETHRPSTFQITEHPLRPARVETDASALVVSGRVIDGQTRVAITGADVTLRRGDHTLAAATSDADGHFSLQFAGGGAAHIEAVATGFGRASAEAREDQEVVVALFRGVSISGVVVREPASAPVEGARVTCGGVWANGNESVATSDKSGAFLLDRCFAGHVRLVAEHPGDAIAQLDLGEHAVGERVTGVRLAIPATARLHGRVLDADGSPVAATVFAIANDRTLDWSGGAPDATAETGADGSFELSVPSVPETIVAITATGRGAEKPLGAGEREITLRLEKGKSISGHVLLDGAPAAASVKLRLAMSFSAPESKTAHLRDYLWMSRHEGTFSRSVAAGSDGAFKFDDVPDGDYAATASASNAHAEAQAHAGDQNVVLSLSPRGEIHGVFVRAGRVFIEAEGEVTATPLKRKARSNPEAEVSAMMLQDLGTVEDGQFRISNLEPGEYRLLSEVPGADPANPVVTVKAGIVSEISWSVAPGGSGHGRVLDARGKPLAGASISVRVDSEDGYSIRDAGAAGPDGRFVVSNLAGKLSLQITHPTAAQRETPRVSIGPEQDFDFGDITLYDRK